MRTATVSELKKCLRRYLRLVASGEDVVVTVRGVPVASLERLAGGKSDTASLVAAGLARAPLAPLPDDFLTRLLPVADVRGALLADRREQR